MSNDILTVGFLAIEASFGIAQAGFNFIVKVDYYD